MQLHELYQLEYMPELEDDPDFPPELEKTAPEKLPELEKTELDILPELAQLKLEYAKLSEEFEQKAALFQACS